DRAPATVGGRRCDIAAGDELILWHPRIKLRPPGVISRRARPSLETVHGGLRPVAIVELERKAEAFQPRLNSRQRLGGRPRKKASIRLVSRDRPPDEIVRAGIEDIDLDRRVEFADIHE